MIVNNNIYREYDIRGVYPTELNEKTAYHVGRAFGSHLVQNRINMVVVGMDNRSSSPFLAKSLIDGLLDSGINVTECGVVITPAIAYFTCAEDFAAGICITASHNPQQFNGIKLYLRNADPFFGEQIQLLKKTIERENYIDGKGTLYSAALNERYIDSLVSRFKFSDNEKIVVSARNGAAGLFAPEVFRRMGCNVIELDCVLDSNFPKGIPDPEKTEYMRDVAKVVIDNKAKLGFAIDTDGDRLGVCDENGNVYQTEKIFMLLSEHVLKKYPGSEVAFDVKCSYVVEQVIREFKGIPKLLRTGRSFFAKEIQNGTILGGEFSGHIYFGKDYYPFDDAIYTAARVLEIVVNTQKNLSSLLDRYPKTYHTGEIKIDCSDKLKSVSVAEITKLAEDDSEISRIEKVDGIRAYLSPASWFLVRASNTSPYLSCRLEGASAPEADVVKSKLTEFIKKVNLPTDKIQSAEILYN